MISENRELELTDFLTKNNLYSNDLTQIDRALTHPSYTNENLLSYLDAYERLEFLGDSVLKLIASKYLFNMFQTEHEGELTKIRSVLVSDACLEKLGHLIGIETLIKMGNVERNNKCIPASIVACAFEGLLGGLYLSCDMETIEKFLYKCFETVIDEIKSNHFCINAKALLQEYTQGLNKDLPEYVIQNSYGPEHNKTFEVGVFYQGELLAIAEGKNKKEAQQNAAAEACKKLGIIE